MTEHRSARQAAGRGGFTLLEVLVAMVVISIGIVGLQALGVTAIRANAEAARQTTYTAWMSGDLEETLFRIRYAGHPDDVTTGSECEERGYGELCTTTVLVDETPNFVMYEVTVTLTPSVESVLGGSPLVINSYAMVPIPPPLTPEEEECLLDPLCEL